MAGSEPINNTFQDTRSVQIKIRDAYHEHMMMGSIGRPDNYWDLAKDALEKTGEMYPEKWIGRRP